MERLLHSAKFWTAVLDAVAALILLLATRYFSPDDVDFTVKLIAIMQPVILAVIAGFAYEDGQAKRALLQFNLLDEPDETPELKD